MVCLSLDNRNTINNTYVSSFSGPHFTSEGAFFFVDSLRASFPEPCLDTIMYLSCIATNPPCDAESDLPLRICEESCVAYNMLMSGPTCDVFNEEVANFQLAALVALRRMYLEFDCNDTATYFFEGNDTVFDTENCTNLFAVETQSMFLGV